MSEKWDSKRQTVVEAVVFKQAYLYLFLYLVSRSGLCYGVGHALPAEMGQVMLLDLLFQCHPTSKPPMKNPVSLYSSSSITDLYQLKIILSRLLLDLN